MKHGETVAPVAAAVSAVATLACCLPVGFAAAALTGSIGAFIEPLRSWFLGASVLLIVVSTVQIARRRHCDRRAGATSIALLAASAVIVLMVMLFPQVVAGIVADWVP